MNAVADRDFVLDALQWGSFMSVLKAPNVVVISDRRLE